MGALETTLIGGATAFGGWILLRRLHDWDPQGSGAGAAVARAGTSVTDQIGRATETSGKIAGGVIRSGGGLTAKTAGLAVGAVGTVANVAVRVVPGVGGKPSPHAAPLRAVPTPVAATPASSTTTAAKKAAAKKPAAKKTATRKPAAKKTATKKPAVKKTTASQRTATS